MVFSLYRGYRLFPIYSGKSDFFFILYLGNMSSLGGKKWIVSSRENGWVELQAIGYYRFRF